MDVRPVCTEPPSPTSPFTAGRQRNLEDYQEHGCDSPNAHPVLPGPGGAGAGLGSSLYFLAGQMTAAYDTRSPFLFYGYLNYAMSPWCSERNAWGLLSCYFRPLTHQVNGPAGPL